MTEPIKFRSFEELPLTLRAEDLASALGISKSSAYMLMHNKDFPTLHVGKRMLVNRDKFIQWMNDRASAR